MKMKTNMRIVMSIKSMKERCITPITTAIDLRALRMRVTRSTRNVLKTRTVRKAYRLPAPLPPPSDSIMISTMESMTTPPSRRFIFSAAYFLGPRARSLSAISTIKIHVKIVLSYSKSFYVELLISYESIAMTTVLTSTLKVKKFSKMLNLMKAFMVHRIFFTVL